MLERTLYLSIIIYPYEKGIYYFSNLTITVHNNFKVKSYTFLLNLPNISSSF